LISLACVPASVALGQDEGPVIVGVERQWEGFHFEPVHLSLDLLARSQRSTIDQANGETLHDEIDEFQETLTAYTSGYWGHPNFISFDLSGTFGLSQQFVRSDSENRDEDPVETIYEYDLSATLFELSSMPFTAYARRSQTFLERQFGDSIESTSTEEGALLLMRDDPVPTTLHYFHRTDEQTSQINPADYHLDQHTLEWQSQWTPGPDQSLTWDYTIDKIKESGDLRLTNSFVRQNAVATHLWNFGEDDRSNLRSTFFFFDETGNFPLQQARLDEALRLWHSPQLESLYDYTTNWQDNAGAEQLFQRGSAGLRHYLFDSLITGIDVGASLLQVDPDDFTSSEFFGDLTFDYDKEVPMGRLTASYRLLGNVQDNSERGQPLQVSNQTFVFPPSGIIIIQRQNIEPGSIVVTNINGIIIYSEGLDHTAQYFPDRAEIRRVLGGDIVDGQAVLVDYRIGPEPASTISTIGNGVTVRYDLEETWLAGLGVYGRYFQQDQEVDSDSPDAPIPADVNDLVAGVDYRRGYFFALAEQQWHDSSVSPYDATRLSASYVQPLGLNSSLSLNANYDDTRRTDEGTRTRVTSVGAQWHQAMSRELALRVGGVWRMENDDPGIDLQAFDQVVELTWRHRQTTVYGSLHNSVVDSSADDSHYLTVQIGLRREF
jgi:hypothetical protein